MSNGRLRWLACVVFLLAFAASAEAQVAGSGMRLGFSGSLQVPEGGDPNMTNLISISYFSRFEGGANIIASTAGGKTSGFFFGTLKYNFIGESLFVPFLHGGFGTPLDNTSVNILEYGGGFKAFISERASFDVTGGLQTLSTSGDGGFGGGSSSSFSVRYGLSFYFGG